MLPINGTLVAAHAMLSATIEALEWLKRGFVCHVIPAIAVVRLSGCKSGGAAGRTRVDHLTPVSAAGMLAFTTSKHRRQRAAVHGREIHYRRRGREVLLVGLQE